MATILIARSNPEDRLLVVADLKQTSPSVRTFTSPKRGTTFDITVAPSWAGDSYLVAGTVKTSFGDNLAAAGPATWILHL